MRSRADAAPAFLFVPDLPASGATLELSREESHYLARVCRARSGDQATATDGRGVVAALRVRDVGRAVTVEIESLTKQARTRDVAVWCGAPEGTRADWLVEKLAELGVGVLQPLECRRGSWERSATRSDRWQRLAIAGLRQSQRAFLMEIREPIEIDEALRSLAPESRRWLATIRGSRPGPVPTGPMVGAIGPASGFTAEEEASLEASGFAPISLSEARLRTETAALAWAVWPGLG